MFDGLIVTDNDPPPEFFRFYDVKYLQRHTWLYGVDLIALQLNSFLFIQQIAHQNDSGANRDHSMIDRAWWTWRFYGLFAGKKLWNGHFRDIGCVG